MGKIQVAQQEKMKAPGAAGGAIITLWAKGTGKGTGVVTQRRQLYREGT